jgi:hypothetical protein
MRSNGRAKPVRFALPIVEKIFLPFSPEEVIEKISK